MLTFFQAIVVGIIQGVSELFPVSSLGHSVLLPALFGWHNLVTDQSSGESFYLAFVVGLHVATALALIAFFWRDWLRIIGGFFVTLRTRRVETPDQRMAWMLILATIPVGIAGLLFEHQFRTLFAKPEAAAIFLTINGLILVGAELLKRRTRPTTLGVGEPSPAPAGSSAAVATGPTAASTEIAPTSASTAAASAETAAATASKSGGPTRDVATLKYREAVVIGCAQILALFAGISRSGVTMAAGLARGLSHEDAARFSFLLATPVILAAGVLKIPDLFGPLGNGIRGQILAGSLAAAIAAYLSVRFLIRWFTTRTLWPFAAYCLAMGTAMIIYFA
ncbi:MAG TPA: undecaprenyl-diphosphate phosphatase [Acidimicrobiales bacterium]|nr:undecaprenyl-diphosphate phosphatase [Acidimicrobiales bacterium]